MLLLANILYYATTSLFWVVYLIGAFSGQSVGEMPTSDGKSLAEKLSSRSLILFLIAAACIIIFPCILALIGSASAKPIAIGAAVGVIYVVAGIVLQMESRRLKRAELTPASPCCEKCQYDLTANESGVCPQCGTAASPTQSK